MASSAISSTYRSIDGDNDRLLRRNNLLKTLNDHVQEMTTKMVTLSVYRELPDLALGSENDQKLVDQTLLTISQILQLCVVGSESIGTLIGSIDYSESRVKNADVLAMSFVTLLPQTIDERGVNWLRGLVKAKTTHKVLESLLLHFADIGASPQSPNPLDTRIDAVEAGLLLNHSADLVSLLSLIKTTPLKFDLDAKLP